MVIDKRANFILRKKVLFNSDLHRRQTVNDLAFKFFTSFSMWSSAEATTSSDSSVVSDVVPIIDDDESAEKSTDVVVKDRHKHSIS